MTNLINTAIFFLAAGYLTSVSLVSAYQVLISAAIAYFIYQAIKNKKFLIPKSSYFLLAFAAVATLGLVLNYDIIPKPSKNFGRIKYFLMPIPTIWLLQSWLRDSSEKAKKNLLNTFFLSMVIAGLYAAYTFFVLHHARAKVLTETMRYGYGSAMVLILLLGFILHRKKAFPALTVQFAVIAFVVGFMGMYLTYTRGALLGFLCGLPVLLFLFNRKLGYILGGCSVMVVLTLIGVYLFGSGQYNSRFLFSKNNYSDNIRRSQWQAAIIATKEKPVLGWGLSNFHTQLKRIKIENDLDAKDYNDAHAHNLFLEIASGTGLLGLILFLGWFITWGLEVFRGNTLLRAVVLPMGVVFFVSSQFEVTLDANNASMIFFIYALSCAINLNHQKGSV